MQSIPSTGYYVYTLIRPDGQVFYVGKGTNRRVKRHRTEAYTGCMCPKCIVIRDTWAQGLDITYTIVFVSEDESEVLAYERSLIAQYGKENLANRYAGGRGKQGPRGPRPREVVEKIAAKTRGQRRTEEQRRRNAEAHKGILHGPLSEETKRKIAEAQRGKPKPKHSEAERKAKSERQKGKKRTPFSDEWRKNLSEAHKGKTYKKRPPETEEARQKHRDTWARTRDQQMKARDTEAYRNRGAKVSATKSTPEWKQRYRERYMLRKAQKQEEERGHRY